MEASMSTQRPSLECTPSELKELEAALCSCSCDSAWVDRGLAEESCYFCNCSSDVLALIQQRDALRARLEKLFVHSSGGVGGMNEELLVRLNNIAAKASIRLCSNLHVADACHWREVLSLARGEEKP